MKNVGYIFLFFLSTFSFSQVSKNIDLLANWHEDSILTNSGKVRYSDCFGFVWKNNEYAVIGSTEGTHVFLLNENNQLIPIGFVKGRFSSASVNHRDYAVYKNFLYAVCDEGVSSLQIIDFTNAPNSISLIHEDSVNFGRVHTIFIDTNQGNLFSCTHRSTSETQNIEAPMKVFSLENPINPIEIYSGPNSVIEVHDCYVRNNIAFLNCGFDGLKVFDFTVIPPTEIESISVYQQQGFNHQGWLTPDGKTYIFADETNGTKIKKCAFNGSNVFIQSYFGTNAENGSVPHNIMLSNEFAFVAYYNEGFRIYDLKTPIPTEIAFYDTYPDNSFFQQNGNWGVFSDLPSQRILVSDRQYGLFVLGFNREQFINTSASEELQVFPNPIPENESIKVRLPVDHEGGMLKLVDCTGRLIYEELLTANDFLLINQQLSSGIFFLIFQTASGDKSEQKTIKIIQL